MKASEPGAHGTLVKLAPRTHAHLGDISENLKQFGVNLGGKALEASLVNVVRLGRAKLSHDSVKDTIGDTVTKLDDILAGDNLATSWLEDRGTAVRRRRGGKSQGHESEKTRQMHDGRLRM